MEETLKVIITGLVDKKDDVEIIRQDDERGTLLKVKVIGKQGRIAKAIRTVMKSIGSEEKKKVGIIFEE